MFARRSRISVSNSSCDGPAASAASSASFLLRAVALLAALTTKKRVVPTMMKLITALKKLPYAIPFHDNLERFSTLAALTTGLRISGVMISPTSEVMIALKAPP